MICAVCHVLSASRSEVLRIRLHAYTIVPMRGNIRVHAYIIRTRTHAYIIKLRVKLVQFEEKMDAMNRNKMFPEAPDDAGESD